jgi:hypothetical protein
MKQLEKSEEYRIKIEESGTIKKYLFLNFFYIPQANVHILNHL